MRSIHPGEGVPSAQEFQEFDEAGTFGCWSAHGLIAKPQLTVTLGIKYDFRAGNLLNFIFRLFEDPRVGGEWATSMTACKVQNIGIASAQKPRELARTGQHMTMLRTYKSIQEGPIT